MKKFIKFKDLNFGPHPLSRIGDGRVRVQAVHKFENGYRVSVVGGDFLYGDGVDTFEVAIFDPNGDFHRLDGWYDDVYGWASKQEVETILYQLQNDGLTKINPINHTFI
jgi:hypothetical protein